MIDREIEFGISSVSVLSTMGNEQQGGTSHHFLPDHQGQKGVNGPLWTRNGRISNAKQQPASIPLITSKPPWQLTRDASMDILSRKTTKLSVKQGKDEKIELIEFDRFC